VTLTSEHGKQAAFCTTAGGFFAAHDGRVHFGLGADAEARTVRVDWPSGRTEVWSHLSAGRFLTLTEGSGSRL
jgi:hypothetical protein